MNRAVFLDRDGTLNVERHYLHDPDQLEIIPGIGPALRRLMDAGYRLFIVTNQSGIGRGYYTEADMHAVNDKLTAELAASDGVAFEKIYYAPESPEQEAPGRKPSPKFLMDAAVEFGINLDQSMVPEESESGSSSETFRIVADNFALPTSLDLSATY